jgi:predicted enzyme related to lactoylglutathione lyase
MPDTVPQAASQAMGSGFTVYYMVDSIEEATERIENAGGKLVLPKTQQADSGFFANLTDVEGNRFGIYTMRPEMIQ